MPKRALRHLVGFFRPSVSNLAFVLSFFLIALAGLSTDSYANRCGIQPIPPIGCSGGPRCQCDSGGSCNWVFDCENRIEQESEFRSLDLGKSLQDAQEIRNKQLQNQALETELRSRQQEAAKLQQSAAQQGIDSTAAIEMARIMCVNQEISLSDEDRRNVCSQFHILRANFYEMEKIVHEACAKKPEMQMCAEKRDQ